VSDGLILHSYWRSGAAYRVRIALALKRLDFALVTHDLRRGEQKSTPYLALAPQGLVPALETPDGPLTQSIAIMEYLEECYPNPPLLPQTPGERAIVRAMTALIACDVHPLGNLRVLERLREQFGADEAQVRAWIGHWITAGLDALEPQVARHGQGYCFGDRPTMADCALIPQLYAAGRFGVALAPYPHLSAVQERALAHPAFASAHPSAQSDAD
jgi:maleylpyruvate isomerase